MTMRKHFIVIFLWLLLWDMAVAQITPDRINTENSECSDDDVIISTIQNFDTLYYIINVTVSPEYMRKHIFANVAEFYFWSDTLDLPPKKNSKKKFSQYMLKPHSFRIEAGYTFVKRVVLPAIHDSTLYYRIKNYYVENEALESQIHIINKVNDGHCRYYSFSYNNTNCFLTVYIRARRFNYEYNRIFSPPEYIFPDEAETTDCYVRFLIPLIPNSE
ncbi:MAG: hypothetical protein IJT04_07180 [Bacteroidales bacterium]|nr:hypothetical protein [Bacteroidales bacterium]